jgi:hypothetical protein
VVRQQQDSRAGDGGEPGGQVEEMELRDQGGELRDRQPLNPEIS